MSIIKSNKRYFNGFFEVRSPLKDYFFDFLIVALHTGPFWTKNFHFDQNQNVAKIVDKYSDNSAANTPITNLSEINEIFSPEGTVQDLMKRLESHKDTGFSKVTLKKIYS